MKTSRLAANRKRASVLLVTMIFVLTIAAALVGYLGIIQRSDQMVSRSQSWNSALALAEAGVEEGLAALNSGTSVSTINRSLNGGTYAVTFTVSNNIYITSVGSQQVSDSSATVSRTVRVGLQKQGLFMRGLAAINNIRFNGNGISSDSWNSHDPNQSLNGLYNGYVGTNGDVASVQGLVNIGNHTINGSLYLGPTATYSGTPGQVTGTIYTDANLNYNDITLPLIDTNGSSITWTPAPGASSHTITNSGYYSINDSKDITVSPGITVILDVKSFNFNPSHIDINGGTTNSGNVVMYVESGSVTLSGNSSGGASGNRPENLYVYGLKDVTSITLSGNSSFVGAIYAPEATLTLNGGGNANNLIGAAVVNSVTLNGHYDFHYDTYLGGSQNGSYVVASWQEL